MPAAKDLAGMKFGKLTVIELVKSECAPGKRKRRKWLCQCECGNEVIVVADNLLSGHTLSCGCLQKERARNCLLTHSSSNTRLYAVWCSMRARCNNPNSTYYHRYGGRGITVCQEWNESFESFQNWALTNGYDEEAKRGECTIDRIDNNQGYSPDNCRWVAQRIQMNNVSYNHRVKCNGEDHTIAEWARLLDTNPSNLRGKLERANWDLSKIITD